MGVLAALAAVEEVGLNVITNGEQRAAGCVCRSVHAVGAGHTLGDGTFRDVEDNSDGESGEELFESHGCSEGESVETSDCLKLY